MQKMFWALLKQANRTLGRGRFGRHVMQMHELNSMANDLGRWQVVKSITVFMDHVSDIAPANV